MTAPSRVSEEFWDRLYERFGGSGEGPVNRYLMSEAEDLPAGTALDLGCAQGADALWLARRGWRVTGVDVSAIAIERARENAIAAGREGQVSFAQCDLSAEFPQGSFDLVSAQFLHSPVAEPGERERILRRARDAVARGGRLLVVSHQVVPSWNPPMPEGLTAQPLDLSVPSPEETVLALRLDEHEWEEIRAETVAVEVFSPQGEPGIRADHVLHYRRRSGR